MGSRAAAAGCPHRRRISLILWVTIVGAGRWVGFTT